MKSLHVQPFFFLPLSTHLSHMKKYLQMYLYDTKKPRDFQF